MDIGSLSGYLHIGHWVGTHDWASEGVVAGAMAVGNSGHGAYRQNGAISEREII